MKFENPFLISCGAILFGLLSYSSLQAKEYDSLEAIWNHAELLNDKNISASKSKTMTSSVASEKSKRDVILQQQALKKLTLQKQAAQKLAQQKKWKAAWEQKQKAKRVARLNKQAVQGITLSHAERALATQQRKTPQVKPLTQAQYQWRWKQAQLKKQAIATAKTQGRSNKQGALTPIRKVAGSRYQPNNQPAILNQLPYTVRSKLNAAKLKSQGMSAYVQAVNSPRPLLGHQEKTSRVPASVMKLITSYAALGTLGPNYRWPVEVLTSGKVNNGTLSGDLIIKGYGSPEFGKTELKTLLQGIKRKGIRNVNGRVVFDNSYFNVANMTTFDHKSQSAYNAQPDALLYNERLSSFQVRARGNRVHISTSTPTHNLKIVNKIRKVRRGCRPRLNVSKRGAHTIVTFRGHFSSRCGTRAYSRVISRPAEMIYGAMKSMWKREVGGVLNTQFAVNKAPAHSRLLVRTYSRTLTEILPTIDKDSNNVMARQVLLTIGAKVKGQGSQRAGANAIAEWLIANGLNFPELRIENGSGLSRHARISAKHVGDLLMHAYRSPYRNVLMQSLAVAGVDGTMRRRLKRSHVRGRGFFKTGTLRDVRSIAGYVKAADGKTYVVSIIHNDPRAKHRALAAHDKLIEWVYSGGRNKVALK